MPEEGATLTPRRGEPVPARVQVERLSDGQRLSRALPVGIGGTVLGLATIPVPGLHFVAPWLVPLLSIGAARYLYNRRATVGAVTGTCPACQGDVAANGGAWEEPMWVRCSACNAPLELKLERPI